MNNKHPTFIPEVHSQPQFCQHKSKHRLKPKELQINAPNNEIQYYSQNFKDNPTKPK